MREITDKEAGGILYRYGAPKRLGWKGRVIAALGSRRDLWVAHLGADPLHGVLFVGRVGTVDLSPIDLHVVSTPGGDGEIRACFLALPDARVVPDNGPVWLIVNRYLDSSRTASATWVGSVHPRARGDRYPLKLTRAQRTVHGRPTDIAHVDAAYRGVLVGGERGERAAFVVRDPIGALEPLREPEAWFYIRPDISSEMLKPWPGYDTFPAYAWRDHSDDHLRDERPMSTAQQETTYRVRVGKNWVADRPYSPHLQIESRACGSGSRWSATTTVDLPTDATPWAGDFQPVRTQAVADGDGLLIAYMASGGDVMLLRYCPDTQTLTSRELLQGTNHHDFALARADDAIYVVFSEHADEMKGSISLLKIERASERPTLHILDLTHEPADAWEELAKTTKAVENARAKGEVGLLKAAWLQLQDIQERARTWRMVMFWVALQGFAARGRGNLQQVWIRHADPTATGPPQEALNYDASLAELTKRMDTIRYANTAQPPSTLRSDITKYVLYDPRNRDSINLAMSVAAAWTLLPVAEGYEDEARRIFERLGPQAEFDATFKDKKTQIGGKPRTRLDADCIQALCAGSDVAGRTIAREFAIEHDARYDKVAIHTLRDYGIMQRALSFAEDKPALDVRSAVSEFLGPGGRILGWNHSKDAPNRPTDDASEGWHVMLASTKGVSYVPADHARNLSVMEWATGRFGAEPEFKPKRPSFPPDIQVDDTDTVVAVILSDGDNLQWTLRERRLPAWWDTAKIRDVPVGIGLPPMLRRVWPPMWNALVDAAAAAGHELVCPVSGIGFAFPTPMQRGTGSVEEVVASTAPLPGALDTFFRESAAFMAESGLRTITLLDTDAGRDVNEWGSLLGDAAVAGAIVFTWWPADHFENRARIRWARSGAGEKPVVEANLYIANEDQVKVAVAEISAASRSSAPSAHVIYLDAWATANKEANHPWVLLEELRDRVKGGPVKFVSPAQLFKIAHQRHKRGVPGW